jgi:tRNA modification GTPase
MNREIQLDGIPLKVIDTAGLHSTSDPIEREGIRRAWKEIESSDLVLLLIDAYCGYGPQERDIEENLPAEITVLRVWNKIDLLTKEPNLNRNDLNISVKTGEGINTLQQRIKSALSITENIEGVFIARRRHLEALKKSSIAFDKCYELLKFRREGELVAEELGQVQKTLGQITGEFTNDDLLGKIFSSFCIGK